MVATECSVIDLRDPSAARRELLWRVLPCCFWNWPASAGLGSMVIFLTFFTNLVLLACFLGMRPRLSRRRSQRDFSRGTLVGLLLAMLLNGPQWSLG